MGPPPGPVPWPLGLQVGPGVALHMQQAASLYARTRPCFGAGPLHTVQSVDDELVGLEDATEQNCVGRAVLMVVQPVM